MTLDPIDLDELSTRLGLGSHELISIVGGGGKTTTMYALAQQLPFHHHLGGYTGMVGAYLPQGLAALHAVIANQRVHDGFFQVVDEGYGCFLQDQAVELGEQAVP